MHLRSIASFRDVLESTMRLPDGVRHYTLLSICMLAALSSLWVRSGIPVSAIADAVYDDALFVKLSLSIGAGHWLGPFDDLTLVKGMFYPLFIYSAFFLGLPLKFAEQIVYLSACYCVARMLKTGTAKISVLSAMVFCGLALDPVLWTSALARVIREGLYVSETLALVAMTTSLAFHAFSGRSKPGPVAALSISTGLVAAAFWLTREEGFWIVPSLAVGVTFAAASTLRSAHVQGSMPIPAVFRLLRRSAVPFGLALIAFAVPVLTVATANFRRYGAFETTEVQSYAFRRAYAALADIEQDGWRRFVVFPKDARRRAYRASPAARELAPSLDGASGENWRRGGCEQSDQGDVTDCPEILAGWFQWAFRDAVAEAGHYTSAKDSAAYYVRLADQIEAACQVGDLRCLPQRATLAPPFRWSYVGDTWHRLPEVATILSTFGSGWISPLPSSGTDAKIASMSDMVGPVEPPPSIPDAIKGWVRSSGPLPTLQVQSSEPGAPTTDIDVSSGSDVAADVPGSTAERFEFETRDLRRDSLLLIKDPVSGATRSLPLGSLATEAEFQLADVTLSVESGLQPDGTAPSRKRERVIDGIAAGIGVLYAALAIPSCAGALCGLVLAPFFRPDRALSFPFALALASGVGVVARVGLLTYLDVTAIPSANILYLSPAAPLLIVFIVVGCALLAQVVRDAARALLRPNRRDVDVAPSRRAGRST